MPCIPPDRGDTEQRLLFKIASCLSDGDFISGVASFNGRTGVVTLTAADIATALGCTPACEADTISQADGDARYVLKSGDSMTGALSINNGVLVANEPALELSQTWNNAAVTFTGLYENITLTAASANSNLFNFQVNGSDRFNFTSGGTLRAIRQDASDAGVNFILRKRGNAGDANGAVAADSTIGAISYSGWDGTAFATGSHIDGLAAEAWTNVAHGSRINFYTTPVGSTTEQLSLQLNANGQARFLDGTAALPSIAFQSDPDTGIYRIGANSFGSSAGGSVILATSATGINLTDALAYQYNSVNVIRAQTALNNFFFGPSGNLTMTGVSNNSAGFGSLALNTSGERNSAFGHLSLAANTTGSSNTAIGVQSLQANTTGSLNTAIGYLALSANTTGDSATAVGYLALSSNTSGIQNSAFGRGALQNNTSGQSNVASGFQALFTNTTGDSNTAIGVTALFSNTTGIENVAIGRSALFANTTGSNSTAVGRDALLSSTGSNNTAFGFAALKNTTTGSSNTGDGFGALFNVTTGSQNTAIGYFTGLGITTGSNNTIVGANVGGLAAALSNNIILADGAGVIRLQIDGSGNTTLAGTVATAAGTAALPAHTFSADLNTGLYNIGADSVGLSTNGVLRVTTNTTDLILATAFRLAMASGANQRAGNLTLIGGTLTVANTSVTANTIILLTRKTAGGTIGTAISYTVIAATSFTVTSDSALDTSTFSYLIIEVP